MQTAMNPAMSPPSSTSSPQQSHSTTDYSHAQSAAATASAALSQAQSSTTSEVNLPNGKKRKATGPGNRGVANLTPDQLAKKRANDREAQRAIRERTKTRIEALEQEIKDLKSRDYVQELHRVTAERDWALAKVNELERRMDNIHQNSARQAVLESTHKSVTPQTTPESIRKSSAPQASLDGELTKEKPSESPAFTDSDADLAALTAMQSRMPTGASQQRAHRYEDKHALPPPQPGLRSLHPTAHASPGSIESYGGQAYEGAERKAKKQEEHRHSYANARGQSAVYDHHGSPVTSQSEQSNDEGKGGISALLDASTRQSTDDSMDTSANFRLVTASDPEWAQIPCKGENSCLLDSLLNDFIASKRKLIHDGSSSTEAIGPDTLPFTTITDKTTNLFSRMSTHPLGSFLTDILSKYPDISRPAEQVAVLYIMFLVTRWLICPSPETFSQLPEWCKPTQIQLNKPHSTWIDYLPWPFMRNRLCSEGFLVDFEKDFFVPYTTTLSLNWPLPSTSVLDTIPNQDDPSRARLSPLFEAHLLNLSKWSLGSKFEANLPFLVDESVRVKLD